MPLIRSLDVDTQGAIRNRNAVVPRDFLVFTGKNRETGEAVERAFWTEAETVSTSVVNESNIADSHDFAGGAIIKVDSIPMRIGIEVRTIQIVLSSLHPEVQNFIRGDDPRGALAEIYRGYLDPETYLLASNPRLRFLGKVNGTPIETPAAGGQGKTTLKIVSHTRELTFVNHAVKSDSEQRKRQDDRFRRYAGKVKEWPIFWGIKK